MKKIVLAVLVSTGGLNAQAAWEIWQSEQLFPALAQAFPEAAPSGNACSQYMSFSLISCTINQSDPTDIECVASASGDRKFTTKDIRLVKALEVSEIPFKKQAELFNLNCSRTIHNEGDCIRNQESVTCRIESWGGN